jgi:hypothetical protein
MTATSGEPKDPRALIALTELARDSVERPTAAELDQGLDALFSRIAAGRARRRGLARWSVVAATAAVCIVGGLHVASRSLKRLPPAEPPALAYQIEGGSVLEGGYLRESGHAGIRLSFEEGTKFLLMPGTRGRLRTVDKEGARIAIEQGTASFQVTHNSDRRWLVEVGPFLVTVKGTIFTVSWDASGERFELRLRRGRVVVSGPISGGDMALRAGQRLVVNLPRAETLISEEKPEDVAGEPIGAPVSPAVTPPTERPSSIVRPSVVTDKAAGRNTAAPPAPSTTAKIDGERRWSDELASGHWDRILEQVERAGLKATLAKASSDDLFALADAARYRRRTDVARAALLAERRRFPESPRSLDAVFLLGRVEESSERGMARAIEWYDEYLSRAPTGAYAAEALGRKMTLTSELEGPARARPVAEEYLRRFPGGSYAGSARALRRVP